jgi:hypothetical protein
MWGDGGSAGHQGCASTQVHLCSAGCMGGRGGAGPARKGGCAERRGKEAEGWRQVAGGWRAGGAPMPVNGGLAST